MLRRNSSTRRRSRSLVIVSPTTLAGGLQGQVGDLGAKLTDRPDLLRLDIGGRAGAQALELLLGRGDVGVTRLLRDLLGARQDLVRLPASLGQGRDALRLRVLAIAPGLLRVLEALLDALLAVREHLRDGLERERPDDREEQQEVGRGDDDLEQVHLEERPGFRLGRQADDLTPELGRDGEQVHDVFSVPGRLRGLDEDREQADDDREDAEALGEGREDDRDTADLSGRVGVATDGRGRQAAEDADADAGAENPESSESGADVLHVVQFLLLPERAARVHWTLDGCAVSARQCAGWSPDGSLPSMASSASSATWPSSSW